MLKLAPKLAPPARVLLVLPHLGIGGAQRVATMLANHWADRGLDVHLVTTVDDKDEFYQVSPRVKRHVLRKTGLMSRIFSSADDFVRHRLMRRPLAQRGRETGNVQLGAPSPSQRAERLKQILRLALRTGDLRLLCALPIHLLSITLRQGLFQILCYCIKKRALGRDPSPYLKLLHVSLWRVSALRKLVRISQPDVVLSFLGATNITTIASAKGLRSRVVISERNDPGRQHLDEPWESLRPIIYPAADVVTANSHGALEHMQRYCASAKLGYVPNPISPLPASNLPRSNTVLFVARLVPQKGPDLLIEAFAKFVGDNPDWSLGIAGDGPMDSELKSRVESLGIAHRVTFHGLVSNPTELLMRARIFVLPSRFEGTPNSLLEAMAARLACIVTNASPGPLRLIEHQVSGLVVKTEDVDDLGKALHRLARDPALRQKLAQAAWNRTRAFRLDFVANDWENLLFPDSGRPSPLVALPSPQLRTRKSVEQ